MYLEQPWIKKLTPLKRSTVLSHCDSCNCHLVNIFIDVLCPAVHSWLLTANLLWCWRITRRLLCRICAGVDRRGATDIKGKHVSRFGSSGWLNSIYCRQLRHSRQLTHNWNNRQQTFNCSDDLSDKAAYIWNLWFRCTHPDIWKKVSISDFVSCNSFTNCDKTCNQDIKDKELTKNL